MTNQLSCIVVDDEPMGIEIIESFINKTPQLKLINTFDNAIDALRYIEANKIDIAFLDINMPEINGISLAKLIGDKSKIIFTTAHREFAIEGFNLNVTDYLLKPIAYDRFIKAVNKLKPKQNADNSSYIFVRSDRKMIKINFEDISHIESLSDYIKIHLYNKTIITRETISNIESKIPSQNFIRTHRSYIVSIKAIESFTNEYIEINKKAIPISRSYKESVLKTLQQ